VREDFGFGIETAWLADWTDSFLNLRQLHAYATILNLTLASRRFPCRAMENLFTRTPTFAGRTKQRHRAMESAECAASGKGRVAGCQERRRVVASQLLPLGVIPRIATRQEPRQGRDAAGAISFRNSSSQVKCCHWPSDLTVLQAVISVPGSIARRGGQNARGDWRVGGSHVESEPAT
jgi:hypothetical protein